MPISRIASIDREWSAADCLRFLAAVANGEVDASAMRAGLPEFLAGDGGSRLLPPSPLLQLRFRALTRKDFVGLAELLGALLKRIGPHAAAGAGIKVPALVYFAGGRAGLLVAGPLDAVMLHQAIRVMNAHRAHLNSCRAFAPGSRRQALCGRWFVIRGQRGPERQWCSPRCRGRIWAADRCPPCGRRVDKRGKCGYCGHVRRRWAAREGASLLRIATDGATGGPKTPQVPSPVRKKARQSPRGNRRA